MNNRGYLNSPLANPSPLASGPSMIRLEETMSPQPGSTNIAATPASIATNTSNSGINDDKWSRTANSVEQLKSLELIPLVLDLMEGVNGGKIQPKDVENSAGTIRVRINKARELLKNIHGLAESPEERLNRVEKLNQNIEKKNAALARFKELVGEKFDLTVIKSDVDMKDVVEIDGNVKQEASATVVNVDQKTTTAIGGASQDVEMI